MRVTPEGLAVGAIGLCALALPLPFLGMTNYYVHLGMVIAIYSILLLGLDIVVGYTGEVSLGHAALFGIGAYTAGVLLFQLKLGLWFALPAAMAVTALFGLLLALPALKVTGPYLAMVTLAFGTIVQILINEMTPLTNGPMGIKLNRPLLLGYLPKDREYYFLVLLFLGLSILVVNRILRSGYGRAFQALRDAPIASDCMGVSVWLYKVYAFVISAAMAGLAGTLFAYSEQYISPNTYSFELTILFLLAVTMGGRKSRLGVILGASIVVLLPNYLADIDLVRLIAALIGMGALMVAGIQWHKAGPRALAPIAVPLILCLSAWPITLSLASVTDYKLTIFGLMILFVVFYLPEGLIGRIREILAPLTPAAPDIARPPAQMFTAEGPRGANGEVVLNASSIKMYFGGLRALDGVSLSVKRGEIHGLIGPNGSGKSTLMNVLSGLYRPTGGEINLGNVRIDGHAPPEIALRGIARTFQNVQLFGEMTATENVLVALNHRLRGNLLDIILATPRYRRSENDARARAFGLLDFVGLGDVVDEKARNLPYGKCRLLEIARALALDPQLLLLDEPAAGLSQPDIELLIDIVRRIRDLGVTIVLIEHHMDVVMSMCDTVTVLDFGQVIAEGTPQAVRADPRVIEAYLGVAG